MQNNISLIPNFSHDKNVEGIILGIDEVGRGCVAGPVVVAGVILNDNIDISQINDSKKLSATKREKIFNSLKDNCHYLIESSSVEEIEEINILQASLLAMRRVINNIEHKFDHVFVDGNISPDKSMNNISTIVGGDNKSLSIAAASIFAKVARDRLMYKLNEDYPEYLWKQNKGYCTKQHIDAIRKFGITPHHRKSFLKKIIS
jgi:ribonuclease HII